MTTVMPLNRKTPVTVDAALVPLDDGDTPRISKEVALVFDPKGARAESIRALRTHIIAQHIYGGRRALAICAPEPGVGCTALAVNLAVSLAQTGLKTLLIDADLRKPGVDALIPTTGQDIGLKQFLSSSNLELVDAIEPDVLPNLSVLHAGGVASNPQELLAGERFQDLADVCLRDYEVTIIDTPPANGCADARRIGNVIGYGLVVAKRDGTFVNDVKVLIDQLRDDHVRVIGTVLSEA